jgi:hypothetical protein
MENMQLNRHDPAKLSISVEIAVLFPVNSNKNIAIRPKLLHDLQLIRFPTRAAPKRELRRRIVVIGLSATLPSPSRRRESFGPRYPTPSAEPTPDKMPDYDNDSPY